MSMTCWRGMPSVKSPIPNCAQLFNGKSAQQINHNHDVRITYLLVRLKFSQYR
jgi:hypothetical protein